MKLINKNNLSSITGYDSRKDNEFEYGSHKCLVKTGFFSNKYEYIEGFKNVLVDICVEKLLPSHIYTKKEVLEVLGDNYFIKDNYVYEKPRIVYKSINGDKTTKHYDTYENVVDVCKNIKATYNLDFILA